MKLTAAGYTKEQLEAREPLLARLKSIGRYEADLGMQINGIRKQQKAARASRNLPELDRLDQQVIDLKKKLLQIAVQREQVKDQLGKLKSKAGFKNDRKPWSIKQLARKLFGRPDGLGPPPKAQQPLAARALD